VSGPGRRGRGRGRGRRATVATVALTVAVLATGCAGARNSLGTNAGVCFKALPEAKAAVGGKGQLVGVRRVSTAELRAHLPNDPQVQRVQEKDLCVLAFKGTYRASDVPLATNAALGKYAVVALPITHPRVVAALILDQLPTRFTHLR
jgi:hypothetical protein